MLRQRWLIVGLLAAVVLGGGWILARNDMDEKTVLFDIGLTPEATAKKTRLPLSGQNTDGYIDFGFAGFPDGVYAKLDKPGYEIKVGPLFAINFYADTKVRGVSHAVTFGLNLDHITTPEQAYDYVYGLIAQFQRGKWKRYIPEKCPRLQGKSSLLDQQEIKAMSDPELKNFMGLGCPVDPAYKPDFEEWKRFVTSEGPTYLWRDGAGKIARLDLTLSDTGDAKFGMGDFRIDLEFELEEVMLANEKRNLEDDLKKPWGARVAKVEIEKRRIRDLLEAMALKREEQLAER